MLVIRTALVTLVVAGTMTPARAQDPARVRSAVSAYTQANDTRILRELADLVAIPNLASDSVNIRRNAAHLAQMLERRGIAARAGEREGLRRRAGVRAR